MDDPAPPLPPLPEGPGVWPLEAWAVGNLPASLDEPRFHALVEAAFGAVATPELGESHALVIVQGGRLIFERYNEGFGPDQTYRSWSMAKSITHALVGLLVGDNLLDLRAPLDVPEWRDDARAEITLDHLLRMSSGLDWTEHEVPGRVWDTQVMLFGEGQSDMAGYAAKTPLLHTPGERFAYCSGGTNIICRALGRALGAQGPAFRDFMRARLFGPVGMTTPKPRWDAVGTFIGSSFCRASARDFARFGLLYLRDGVWNGQRVLPAGWVDHARTPTYQRPGTEAPGRHGAHWWLDFGGRGSFSAHGSEGQYILCVPDLDLVLVRHGETPANRIAGLDLWVAEVIQTFRPREGAAV